MNQATINNKIFEIFIRDKEISDIVNQISSQINKSDIKDPLFISILNGSFLFTADIFRKITIPNSEITFVKLSSYNGTETTGKVNTIIGLEHDLSNRNVIILEDIIDTGITLEKVIQILKEKNVAEIKIATLLFKPEAYQKSIPIDFIGKEIPNDFVIGYGLDYNEYGRNLPHIYKLKNKEKC
mgnify:CR=1 FL=1